MIYLGEYGVALDINFVIPKVDDTDLAATGDWTPATGDTKITKDGGTMVNTTNNPSAVAGTGSLVWNLVLTATEMQAKQIVVQIVDAALENQALVISTVNHASAEIPNFWADVQEWLSTTAVAIPTNWEDMSITNTSGIVAADTVTLGGVAQSLTDLKDFADNGYNPTFQTVRSNLKRIDDVTEKMRAISPLSYGTATAGAASTITFDAADVTDVDRYKDCIIRLWDGTGWGQARLITAYSAGRVATVTPAWDTTPDATTEYHVYNRYTPGSVDMWTRGVPTGLTSGRVHADMRAIEGTAQDAIDLGDFAANCYNPATQYIFADTWRVRGSDAAGTRLEALMEAINDDASATTMGSRLEALLEAFADDTAATSLINSLEANIGNLDASVAAIPTTAMRGTDSAYTGTPPTSAAIADQVWDELQSAHVTGGSFGELATEIAAILADTNELQSDNVPGLIAALNNLSSANVDTALATYDAPTKAELDSGLAALNDPTAAVVADAVWDELQSAHVTVGSFGEIATEIAAIPTTAMRGTDSAALASVATEGRLAELDAANIPADLDAVLADTGELQTDWVNGGRLDLLLDAIPTTAMRGTDSALLAASVNVAAGVIEANLKEIDTDTTAVANLKLSLNSMVTGTSTGTPTTAVIDTDLSETTDDHYKDRTFIVTSGGEAGVARLITGYNGTTKEITVDAMPVAIAASVTFIIV